MRREAIEKTSWRSSRGRRCLRTEPLEAVSSAVVKEVLVT